MDDFISPQKFRDKYRISSSRLKNFDYSNNGAYFVTICTQDRQCFFGEILDRVETPFMASQEINYSKLGKIAAKYWEQIPNHFLFVSLGEYVVMPNHVHGIIMIDNLLNDNRRDVDLSRLNLDTDAMNGVATTSKIMIKNNPMQQQNLSKVIRWYKGRITFEVRKTNPFFAWQSRFHDRIIRNQDEYNRISDYIKHNPLNWKEDDYFSSG
jgi:REP element-mobilizing transposase RayT